MCVLGAFAKAHCWTFDRIGVLEGVFAMGQVYVLVSRVTGECFALNCLGGHSPGYWGALGSHNKLLCQTQGISFWLDSRPKICGRM